MRALVTGATGFVGGHLCRKLLSDGATVYATKRWRSNTSLIKDIEHKVRFFECDLTDPWAVQDVFNKVEPNQVYHLAAQSYVDSSYTNPSQTLHSNITGTANILEVIKNTNRNIRMHFASSSEVYGQVEKYELPIMESNRLRPASPYAVSKAACDLLSQHYIKAYGLKIVITRSFTHTGPGRGEVFAEASFAKQIAQIEAGAPGPLLHGNLDSLRTWLDVRDIVDLFVTANKICPPGVYVVGGDTQKTIGEVMEFLKSLSTVQITSKQVESKFRPSDVTLQVPDSTPIREITGWKPKIQFLTTMTDLLNFWRAKIAEER